MNTKIDDIASKQNIPKQFLVHILLQLKSAGIVGSTRGVGGGYYMAKSPTQVSLGDVVEAVEATLSSPESRSDHPAGDTASNAVLFTLWHEVERDALGMIDRVTIADLVERTSSSPEYVI